MKKESDLTPQVIYQQYPESADEIDISELFNKIWLRRWFILAMVFIAGVFTAGILAIMLLIKAPEKQYSEILQFNFPTAEKGLYPSGQKFSSSDIVSAKILEDVYRKNNIESTGINFDEFISAISVSPYADNEQFIKEKYQGLLTDKKLTRPEIEAMESRYIAELTAAQSRFVRLSFLESELLGLDRSLIHKVLMDIPRSWSKFAIEELGVLDLKIVGADFYQPALVKRFEYIQTLEYLTDSAGALNRALNDLAVDEIGGLVRDPESGLTAYDLQIQLKNLLTYEIEPHFASVSNLGITKNTDNALSYLENAIQNLADKKNVLLRKSENYEKIVDQYSATILTGQNGLQQGAGGVSQFDGSFIDKFASLVEEKSDNAFKQGLLRQKLEILQDIESIDGQLIKLQRAEKKLMDSVIETSETVRSEVIKNIDYARENFEKLLSGYKNLLAKRNQQVLGSNSSLYRLTNNDLIIENGLVDRLKKIILISILAGIIALMLAVIIALFKSLPEKSQHASKTAS